jgi:hypothetical protein
MPEKRVTESLNISVGWYFSVMDRSSSGKDPKNKKMKH